MADEDDRLVAIQAVLDLVQPDVAPGLTQGEIELEVDRARLARTYEIDTEYRIGEVIVPPVRNGHVYVVTQPGTSGLTLPAYTAWLTSGDASFYDGSSNPRLTFEELGGDLFNEAVFGAETNIYDINRAARQCWKLKARKASQFINEGDVSFEQIYRHCLEQAESFIPYRRETLLARG